MFLSFFKKMPLLSLIHFWYHHSFVLPSLSRFHQSHDAGLSLTAPLVERFLKFNHTVL